MKVWAAIGGIALLVGVLAVSAIEVFDLNQPREAQCPQGDALRTARLLDKARETYEGADEKCTDEPAADQEAEAADQAEEMNSLTAVEEKGEEAERHFATAGVYASASTVEEGKSAPPGAKASSEKAVDEYGTGLNVNPFDENANLALTLELNKDLVEAPQQCEAANDLATAGLLTVAGVALSNAAAAGAERCREVAQALNDRRESAADLLREGRALEDRGAARQKYAEALLENANLAAAKAELEGSLNDETRLDEVGSAIADVVDKARELLVPVVVALLALALATWIAVREGAARSATVRRWFQSLGKHPGLSFFYKAAVPAVSIEDFTGKGEGDLEGAYFSTLLAAETAKQTGREPAFPFDRVVKGREDEENVVAKLGDAIAEEPATKLLGSLVKIGSKLFRRRTVRLEGRLAPAADQGAGVLLAIESNGREPASISLWEKAYDPKPGGKGAARWLRLAPAATVWARWQLAAAHAHPEQVKTEPWHSDALFQSAQAWQAQGEFVRAEALYAEALEKDPGLLPAAHNLSVIEIRSKGYARAKARVEALRRVLENGDGTGRSAADLKKLWPTLDTASLYTLTLALAYPEIDKGADGDLGPAIDNARDLVSILAREIEPTEGEDRPAASATEELTLAEPASVVLLASLTFRGEESEQQEEAVSHAIGGGGEVQPVTRTQLRDRDSVGDLEPWKLIHGYVEKQRSVSRRTHYNLACYFTTLSEQAGGERRTSVPGPGTRVARGGAGRRRPGRVGREGPVARTAERAPRRRVRGRL